MKADANFRHIKQNDQTDSTWTDVQFDALSYDSRTVSPMTLFCAKGLAFKKEFLEKAIEAGLAFYVYEINYEVGIPAIIVH
ncbi:UDP-N-acetylmuramoyl-L-alanyl-D-glutamate--L-lysine ligase, partial [Streptococcus suis]